jgi:hypothetical protein
MMRPRLLLAVCALSLHGLLLISLRTMLQVAVIPDFYKPMDPIEIEKPSLTAEINQHATTEAAKEKALQVNRNSIVAAEEKQAFGSQVFRQKSSSKLRDGATVTSSYDPTKFQKNEKLLGSQTLDQSKFKRRKRSRRFDQLVNESKLSGYKPTGGVLPKDDDSKKLISDPRDWPSIDNGTCLEPSEEPPFPWQKRAPHAILLGTMKGGTHAVIDYLWQHPNIVRNYRDKKELHFYDFDVFQRNHSGIPQRQNQIAYAEKFAIGYPDLFSDPARRIAKEGMYAIDDSPRYLLWSDRTPEAIMCVSPWAKLMAILRNPIDRAVSHFRYQDEARQRSSKMKKATPMVDWEVWIEDDLRLLKNAGVVRDWNEVDFDTFAGSEEETLSWKRYLRQPNSNMILGRGLYAIQLEHYFSAMEKVGKSRSELLVIQSEDLLNNTQAVYGRMLDFLDLPPHRLEDSQPKHKTTNTASAMPLPDHLRKKLEVFYEPYNRRLYSLLHWDAVWQKSS